VVEIAISTFSRMAEVEAKLVDVRETAAVCREVVA